MESNELTDAIHRMEITLTEKIHLHTTALQLNTERLENLRKSVDRHHEILYGPADGEHLGLVQHMHEVRNADRERKWTIRTVTASFLGLSGKFIWDLFHGN